MTVLPDWHIEYLARDGCILPFDEANLQPSSYDVRLGNVFYRFDRWGGRALHTDEGCKYLDPTDQEQINELFSRVYVADNAKFFIYPGEFVLAGTLERIRVPRQCVSRLEGKSSLGRLGLAVHVTAGFIDPGFEGNITLEMVNMLPVPILLRPKMQIAQISFMYMAGSGPREIYGKKGRYQGAEGTQPSRYGVRRTA